MYYTEKHKQFHKQALWRSFPEFPEQRETVSPLALREENME